MADYYDTGTVSVLSGNRTVTGTGTSWAGLIRAGDTLEIGGRQMRVASVESATSLTLKLPAPAAASGAYAIWFSAPSRTSGLQALADTRRLIEVAEILMAMRGDYAVRAAPLNPPPATPVTGDLYIIGTAPTGTWAGYAGYLAQWTGTGWAYTAPQPGMRAYVLGAGVNWQRGETAWGIVPGVLSALGVSGNLADASGKLPDANTPSHLMSVMVSAGAQDFNTLANGWCASSADAPNSPADITGWSTVLTNFATNAGWQIVIQSFSGNPNARIRFKTSSTAYSAWFPLLWTEAQIATRFFSSAGDWTALGSTILARNADAGILPAGNTAAGSSLRPARIMWSGATSSHSSYLTTGTWRLCGASHNANDDDICLYRRIA